MDIASYFQPVDPDLGGGDGHADRQLGKLISTHREKHFPDAEGPGIALIGVCDGRRSEENEGCAAGPAAVRRELYRLYGDDRPYRVSDLGDISPGHTVEDTYFALSAACAELISRKTVPVIIGGSHDLTYANYLAYAKLEQVVNLACIDARVDMGSAIDQPMNSRTFLSSIFLHQPNCLFNFCSLGYQTYLVDHALRDTLHNMHFDAHRLGEVQTDVAETEPAVRNADFISFDLSAIRSADAPGSRHSSPNGLSGREACQIARYAGTSEKLTSIGFYEYSPELDPAGTGAQLVAQMVWCFIDGYYGRKYDFPFTDKSQFRSYRVSVKGHSQDIVFYKSKKSDRWWMDVPYLDDRNPKYERHHLVPCSYGDYRQACRNDVPDRWWKAFQKLN